MRPPECNFCYKHIFTFCYKAYTIYEHIRAKEGVARVNTVAGYIKRSDKALYFLLNKKMHCNVLSMLMRKLPTWALCLLA